MKTGKILVITGAVGFVGLGSFATGLFTGSVLAYDVLERDAKLVREVFGMPPAPKKRDLKYNPYPAARDAARAKYAKRDLEETERVFDSTADRGAGLFSEGHRKENAAKYAIRAVGEQVAHKHQLADNVEVQFSVDRVELSDAGWYVKLTTVGLDHHEYDVRYDRVENDTYIKDVTALREEKRGVQREFAQDRARRELQTYLAKTYDIWDKDFPIDILSVSHDNDGGWGMPIESDYDNIVYSVRYNAENDTVTIKDLNEPRKKTSEKVTEKKQADLGKISNKLTDMMIAGASPEELKPVVEESMRLIDKHREPKKDVKPED